MAIINRPPYGIQSSLNAQIRNQGMPLFGTGAPTNGTSGTGAGISGLGAVYHDITNAIVWINKGTKASPLWRNVGNTEQLSGSITAAQIIATSAGSLGHASGVEMVPAPGAGYFLEWISTLIIVDFATAAYTGGGNTGVKIGGGGAALSGVVANSVIIQAAADLIQLFVPLAATAVTPTGNTGINFVTATAPTNPGTAAGVIRWITHFRTHASGL